MGYRSLWNLTTGNNNVAIGAEAGLTNTTGTGNVYLGTDAGRSHSGSNTLWIENTNANADNALIYGEFDNDILRTNGQLQIGNPTGTGYALPTTDGTLGQVLTTNGGGTVSFQTITDDDTQNTLDEAYDEGGPGGGRTIIATDGAFTIAGEDGIDVTGTFNAGTNISNGAGSRMYFNPRRGVFRAGNIDGVQWNEVNVGNYSVAFGQNTTASGISSFAGGFTATASGHRGFSYGNFTVASAENAVAFGSGSTASNTNTFAAGFNAIAAGNAAVAFGLRSEAPSWGEMTVGAFATTYTANSTTSWNMNDRIFTVGNGTTTLARSNALTIYKDGEVNINDAYSLPTSDGANGQVMTTDGSGTITFESLPTKAVARITMSTNQLETSSGITKVNFDTEDFDIGNNFNLTTDEFEVPANGVYRVRTSKVPVEVEVPILICVCTRYTPFTGTSNSSVVRLKLLPISKSSVSKFILVIPLLVSS